MDYKNLLQGLLKADSEEQVTEILQSNNVAGSKSWKYLGNSPANYSIAGNQQAEATAALVEKLVNSIDAVLMDECMKRGIDPRSPEAPQTMFKAAEQLFNVPEGLLENLDSKERTQLAQRIYLVATGKDKLSPCYTIIDCGEGQSPDELPTTILSLPGVRDTIKSRIKFVQGIFNMGGTGALRFCGYNNYELIVSRRDPALLGNNRSRRDSMWGFTIIRRKDPSELRESSAYEYLAPDGKIMAFESDNILALPGEFPGTYSKPLNWGTCIKLYEYNIRPKALATAATLDLFYELNRHFQQMALPIRIAERRSKYAANVEAKKIHSPETTLAGMTVRIAENSTILEEGFPATGIINVQSLGKIPIKIYAFKPESATRNNHWLGDDALLLLINGQKHGAINKSFLSRRDVDLDYIKDELMIVLDCSRINGRAREDLFMNSRDRLASGKEKDELEAELADFLRNHDGLRILARRRREESLKNALADNRPLKELLTSVIKSSPSLASIFLPGMEVPAEAGFEWMKTTTTYRGKKFPTFFRLKQGQTGFQASCPINSYTLVKFETDASNDYFTRTKDPGRFSISNENIARNFSLWNGIGTLKISPPSDCQVGDIIQIESQVTDKTQSKPFTSSFSIEIVEPIQRRMKKIGTIDRSNRRKNPSDRSDGGDFSIQMPNIIEVHRDSEPKSPWMEFKFEDMSGLKIKRQQGAFDAYINMDHPSLRREILGRKSTDPMVLATEYKCALALCSMGIYYNLSKLKTRKSEGLEENNRDISDGEILQAVNDASDGLALVLLPVISSLGQLTKKMVPLLPAGA